MQRLQLKRTRGWRKPEGAMVVARPSRWGNPFRVGKEARDAGEAVRMFRARVESMEPAQRRRWLEPLRGKDLCCWCRPRDPCHADVLLEWANRKTGTTGRRG